MKQSLDGRPALPETEFNQLISRKDARKDDNNEDDDIASISGSESETESSDSEEEDSGAESRLPRLHFAVVDDRGAGGASSVGKCFSIYRILLGRCFHVQISFR